MSPLTAVKLKITTYDSNESEPNYFGYTLSNTPFFIKPIFDARELSSAYNYGYFDFGDGTSTVGPSAEHVFKYPGTYNITFTTYSTTGEPTTYSTTTDNTLAQVQVINPLPDLVVFDNLLPEGSLGVYSLPAGQISSPLKIYRYNSWQNNSYLDKNHYSIMLYASGSKSGYMSLSSYYTNKWSHLKSYFGFVEKYSTEQGIDSYRIIDSTKTTSVSVYAERIPGTDVLNFYSFPKIGTEFAGTTGTTEGLGISFVDQKPGLGENSLVFLYANLDTRGFIELNSKFLGNNLITQDIPYGYVNYPSQVSYLKSIFNPASKLEITSNGITIEGSEQTVGPLTAQKLHSFSIYPIKWCGSEIPFVVTFKDKNNYTTKCYPPITGVKFDGTDPTDINTISVGLFKYVGQDPTSSFSSTSSYQIDATFKTNRDVPNYESSGSYYAGTLTTNQETKSVTICAAALIQDAVFSNQGTTYGFAGQPGFKNIKRFQKEPIFNNCSNLEVDFSLTGNYNTYTVSTSSTVAISVAPIKSFTDTGLDMVWVADADEDRVFIYSLSGTELYTIKLSGAPTFTSNFTAPEERNYLGDLNSASPSNIAIDKNGNAWVSLYDAVSVIRINSKTFTVDAVVAPGFNKQNASYLNSIQYRSLKDTLSGYVGENLILPTCLDTDTENHVIVGYSHPVSGFIIKYDPNNKIKLFIEIPQLYSLQEILVDKNNNIVAFAKNLTENTSNPFTVEDILYKWNSDGILLSGYPMKFKYIGSLTIDPQQNIWLHHDFCKVSKISPNNKVAEFFIGSNNFDARYYQGIDGIGMDINSYLWILHNYDGKIYFMPTNEGQLPPLSGLYYANLPGIENIAPDGQQAFYSVYGDWTGIRWINKYTEILNPTPRIVRGQSNLFDIIKTTPIITKKNEDFDQTATLKSYILQESLFDKKTLLDNFIGQIVGNKDSLPETLGKTVYEKIANFVLNNSDPDVCNLNALKSLVKSRGLPFYEFLSGYPAKLMRAMDLLSINKCKLVGSPAVRTNNFTMSSLDYSTSTNLGAPISIQTGEFKVGEPIIAYEIFSQKYRVITNTVVPETDNIPVILGQKYPLSGINYKWGWALVTSNKLLSGIDIAPFYIFYNYLPSNKTEMIDNIVDFNNTQTTLSPNNSGYVNWIKYGGEMDKILGRTMYEGLKLINE